MKGEAEAKAQVILSPEEATLTGKLGASLNVVEANAEAKGCFFPYRFVNGHIDVVNYFSGANHGKLDDSWKIGLCATAGGQVAVGAQAEASATGGYKNGNAGFETQVKLGLGPGAGLKFGAEVSGLDKMGKKISDWWNK